MKLNHYFRISSEKAKQHNASHFLPHYFLPCLHNFTCTSDFKTVCKNWCPAFCSGGRGGGGGRALAEPEHEPESEPEAEPEAEPESAPMSIPEIVTTNKDFSTLLAAVAAAGLVEALSAEGPFTVFAPTNDAFAKVTMVVINPSKTFSIS